MHSSILVDGVGKTDPFVPLDTLDHAAGQHPGPARCNRRIRFSTISLQTSGPDWHDYSPVRVCWHPPIHLHVSLYHYYRIELERTFQ